MAKFAPIVKVFNSLIPQKSSLKEGHPESWYFSPEGKKAYESLSTARDKTKFFLNYLCVAQKQSKSLSAGSRDSYEDFNLYNVLYRIAFVMSSSMVDSQLEFGGYPNILDAQKNPFVHYVKHNKFNLNSTNDNSLTLLRILHCELNSESKNDNCIITFLEKNDPLTDIYKIERDIIRVCNVSISKSMPPAYSFALDCMVKNNNQIQLEEELIEAD